MPKYELSPDRRLSAKLANIGREWGKGSFPSEATRHLLGTDKMMKGFRFLLTIARGSALKRKARMRGDSENNSIHTQQLGAIPLSVRWRLRFRASGRVYLGPLLLVLAILATFLWVQSHREAKSAPPPPPPTIEVSGGLKPGYPDHHTFPDPKLLFTWTKPIRISGTGWGDLGSVEIYIRGPLNTLGVEATRRLIGTIDPLSGRISASVTIPYAPNIPQPGHYEVIARQVDLFGNSKVAHAADYINICPATSVLRDYYIDNVFHDDDSPAIVTNSIGNKVLIDWGKERGGRPDSILEGKSPERVDPHWVSVWDETPVEVYGTVEATGHDFGRVSKTQLEGNNQPSFVTHEEWPGDHFGHDVNVMLVPDEEYQWVIGTANFYADASPDRFGDVGDFHPDHRENARLELEWEFLNPAERQVPGMCKSGSTEINYEHGNVGMPAFAMPTVGDRVYTVGRWILDSGHPEKGSRTEIHPPRLIATMRKLYTTISLPIDGQQVPTRASQVDIYVSGHGGGSNKFLDELSRTLGPGGRIRDKLDPTVYYANGPFLNQAERSVAKTWASSKKHPILFAGCDVDHNDDACNIICFGTVLNGGSRTGCPDGDPSYLTAPAGPSAFGLDGRGPEFRGINDMNYEFIVPLPPRPPGATSLFWDVETHEQHSTAVNEVIDYYIDPATGLPIARVRLPYKGADPSIGGGIYARTLKFYWNTYSPPPGNHLGVTLTGIDVRESGDSPNAGEWQMWADIGGHWFYLTGLNPAFLHARDNKRISVGGATAELYLDEGQPLRVHTYGYDSDDFEGWFGFVNENAYDLGFKVVKEILDCGGNFGVGNNQNDLLGGALLEGQATTRSTWHVVSARVTDSSNTFPDRGKGTIHYEVLVDVVPLPSVQPPALRDITLMDGISITRSGFVRTGFEDNGLGRFAQRVVIRNNTGTDIEGPMYLILGVERGQLLTKPAGFTSTAPPMDRPFVVIDVGFDDIFHNGDSVRAFLEFSSLLDGGIAYTIQAMAGRGSPP